MIEMRCEVCGHVYDPNPAGARPITCEHGKYRGEVVFVSGKAAEEETDG